MLKIIIICIGVIFVTSIVIDKDPTRLLAGLGASAAVLMLVFKDSIMGLVAGVQLSANDMLRPGDWITMEKYGADGGYVYTLALTDNKKIKAYDFFTKVTELSDVHNLYSYHGDIDGYQEVTLFSEPPSTVFVKDQDTSYEIFECTETSYRHPAYYTGMLSTAGDTVESSYGVYDAYLPFGT